VRLARLGLAVRLGLDDRAEDLRRIVLRDIVSVVAVRQVLAARKIQPVTLGQRAGR